MINFLRQGSICRSILLLLFSLCSIPSPGSAESVGAFSATLNEVQHLRTGTAEPVKAEVGSSVELKDLVTTLERSRAQVTFIDETVLRIASSSQIEITTFMFDQSKLKNGSIRMIRGTLRSIIHQSDAGDAQFEVRTPTAVAAVRGTDFFTVVIGAITRFVCNSGKVEIRSIDSGVAGVQMCAAGQTVDVAKGQAPTPPTPTDPKLLEQLIADTDVAIVGAVDQASTPPGSGAVEKITAAESMRDGVVALGFVAAAGVVTVAATSSSSVPAAAVPGGGGGTVTVDDSIYVMQAWNPAMSYGAPAGPDAVGGNHVMTVTRDAGNNITSIRIAGFHSTATPAPGTATGTFDYTFNTAVAANELALGAAGTPATPAALANSTIVINQIENLPIVNYQYVSLFHWGVQQDVAGANWLAGIGVFGTTTPVASIPTTGIATYAGIAQGWWYTAAGGEARFRSDLAATADFAARTMALNSANTQTEVIILPGPTYGPLTANPTLDFTTAIGAPAGWAAGTNTFAGNITNQAGMAGTIRGAFFGPAVAVPNPGPGESATKPGNIGGSFTLTGGGSTMVGVFAGQ